MHKTTPRGQHYRVATEGGLITACGYKRAFLPGGVGDETAPSPHLRPLSRYLTLLSSRSEFFEARVRHQRIQCFEGEYLAARGEQ